MLMKNFGPYDYRYCDETHGCGPSENRHVTTDTTSCGSSVPPVHLAAARTHEGDAFVQALAASSIKPIARSR
jgi:hypothetical protein